MTNCIIQNEAIRYPGFEDFFSPGECFPEYEFRQVSQQENSVYAAVRACLAGAGLDIEHHGQPSWNPLGAYIKPGNSVFVLCNFVEERRAHSVADHGFAKCTHGAVVRAVLDYVLKALQGQGLVSFGNAPLQSCTWSKVVQETGADRVADFYRQFHPSAKISLVDLRQHVTRRDALGTLKTSLHSEDEDNFLKVDLENKSLLDALWQREKEPRFRVLDYDPRRTELCHGTGRHIYLMSRRVMASDVVISIPKLKTHEKVGMTCALKGCVGAVAHKDCLAHHRYGPPSDGGDEYPHGNPVLKMISALHETANTRQPGVMRDMVSALDRYSRKVVRRFTRSLSGGWPGNDTCWRMALDLARIVAYADSNGILHPTPQRKHLALTDGIIAGEGDGPLAPRPVHFGYLSFSDNVAIADYMNSLAMGFDPDKIPLVREACRPGEYPMVDSSPANSDVQFNGERVVIGELGPKFPRQFRPPKEWRAILGSKRHTRFAKRGAGFRLAET